jgi:phenylpropionate dioxygenase-like ring-hydroxylating dioxygenase large terminal subunit
MLVTKQPILRRFWYPVMPITHLAAGPKPFRLLETDIVLWLTSDGTPAAIADRCCHRTAKLSRGYCEGGRIVCGYHGWQYDRDGMVVRVPQAAATREHRSAMRTPAHNAAERYGYVWVALDEPLTAIPEFAEAVTPGFRKIDQFYDVWNCAGLRLMENSFDLAHIAFVHRATFGDASSPKPAGFQITRTADGFIMDSQVLVMNRDLQKQILHMGDDTTTRVSQAQWYMPFVRKTRIEYPTGLIHSIVTAATPIGDHCSQIVQFCFRNDTESDTSTADVIRFDLAIVEEDKHILEGTDPDVPLDPRGIEANMASDEPGLVIREMLRDLLAKHGEVEATGHRRIGGNMAPLSIGES